MATREEVEIARDAYYAADRRGSDEAFQRSIDAVDALRACMLDGLREELRTLMLQQHITDARETYSDGFANGLAYSIQKIDAIRAAHAHMQDASLGYVVRWAAEDDFRRAWVGRRQLGYVFKDSGEWKWGLSDQPEHGHEPTEALAKSALLAAIAEYMKGFGLLPTGTYDDGLEAARKAFAALARDYKRDASFDDSVVGAQEHAANQENIARAIENAALKRNQDQEPGR